MVQKQHDLIRLAKPNIKKKDLKRAVNVLKSGNLVEGENVRTFEKSLSEFTKIPFSSVVSSATAGLHLALKALNISTDDFVIVPSFTFPATANAVENTGANVIFCDVNKMTYVIEPDELEKVISANKDKNLKAIIVVHEFGYPAEMKAISEIAKKHKLSLIEDAACALGTHSDEQHVGYYSDAAVFSFHPRKAITSGEGGAIVTKDEALCKKINILKNHGIERSEAGIDFVEAGLNYRMTDFQAALLQGQLERFKKEIKRRKKLVYIYIKELKNIAGINLPAPHENHSWQSFMVVLSDKIDRSKVISELGKQNIQSTLGAQSLPSLTFFKKKYALDETAYKNSLNLYKSGLVLPLYGGLKKRDILRVVQSLKDILN